MRLKPVGQVPVSVIVAFVPSTAAEPFTVSPSVTSATGVDAVPDVAVPVSSSGTMSPPTVIVTVAVSQFGVGLDRSHNW